MACELNNDIVEDCSCQCGMLLSGCQANPESRC